MRKSFYLLAAVLFMAACGQQKQQEQAADILPAENFDTTINNIPVKLYTLKAGDIVLQATNFGGRVVTIFTPDKNGKEENIVLGRRTIREYANPDGERFLGACVGPVANRIGGAKFVLNDTTYNVPANDNKINTLHGGFYGFDNVVWDVKDYNDSTLVLHYLRPDGFEGYPGNLDVTMTYSVNSNDEFRIDYVATTDHDTPVNISNHPFFHLQGDADGTVLDYVMYVNASAYTPIDSLSIPFGENASVEGTPFDFRTPTRIGERIDNDDQQLKNARGYDHNWVIDRKAEGDAETACTVWDKTSGRQVEVLTDQPGIQIYTGNFFNGTGGPAINGKPIEYRTSIALETQHFPDSPNRPNFPSVTLKPGEKYTQVCIYRFSVKDE